MSARQFQNKKTHTGSLYSRHRKHAPTRRTALAFSLVESVKRLRFLVFALGEEKGNGACAGSPERGPTADCSDRVSLRRKIRNSLRQKDSQDLFPTGPLGLSPRNRLRTNLPERNWHCRLAVGRDQECSDWIPGLYAA